MNDIKDTLTPDEKARLRQWHLAHAYDPPPFGQWMRENMQMRNHVSVAVFFWLHMWLFSCMWHWGVDRGLHR